MELLKIAQQMVAGASWPNTPFSFQASGIDRQGAVQKDFLEPVANSCWGGGMEARWGGEKRSRLEWSGAGTIFCTA